VGDDLLPRSGPSNSVASGVKSTNLKIWPRRRCASAVELDRVEVGPTSHGGAAFRMQEDCLNPQRKNFEVRLISL
jgi:hypothetical protein